MCALGLGKPKFPPNPSPRGPPLYPTACKLQPGPPGSKTSKEPATLASPAGCSGIEGCSKDLPPSFRMRVLPWGTGQWLPRPSAAPPAPYTCVRIHLRMSLQASWGLCSCHEAPKLDEYSEATPLHPQKRLQPQRKGGQDLGSGSAVIFLHPSPSCLDLFLSILGPRAPRGPLHPRCPHRPCQGR